MTDASAFCSSVFPMHVLPAPMMRVSIAFYQLVVVAERRVLGRLGMQAAE